MPAPVQYARKLAALVGDRAGGSEPVYARDGTLIICGAEPGLPPVIHQKFDDHPGLYFI